MRFCILCFVLLLTCQAEANEFIPLGDLPEGIFSSNAGSVDASGSVVVGYSSADQFVQAFIWNDADGMQSIGLGASAEAVSADGRTTVGGIRDDVTGVTEPFVWTTTGGLQLLGFPQGEIPTGFSFAQDISGNGNVVVGFTTFAGESQAFTWTAEGGFFNLGNLLLGTAGSNATGVSNDGQVIVGGMFINGQQKAFRWSASEGVLDLGDLPGGRVDSFANDLSPDGSVVFGTSISSASSEEAFRWTAATGMVSLGFLTDLPSSASIPFAATNSGEAIVGQNTTFGQPTRSEAFLWTEASGMESLQLVLENQFDLIDDLSGWNLSSATDISSDGRFIVGTGINPDGNTEAWLVRLDHSIAVPEPTTLLLIAVCFVSFLCYHRQTR